MLSSFFTLLGTHVVVCLIIHDATDIKPCEMSSSECVPNLTVFLSDADDTDKEGSLRLRRQLEDLLNAMIMDARGRICASDILHAAYWDHAWSSYFRCTAQYVLFVLVMHVHVRVCVCLCSLCVTSCPDVCMYLQAAIQVGIAHDCNCAGLVFSV